MRNAGIFADRPAWRNALAFLVALFPYEAGREAPGGLELVQMDQQPMVHPTILTGLELDHPENQQK